jgi:uncharacterized protein with FMN-binding domain
MKKILASFVFITAFAGYALSQRFGSSAPAVSAAASQGATPKSTAAARTTGRYADGTYTGSVADAYYGSVQVQVRVAGGKITDVQFLQYPNDRQTSVMINTQAMPLLTQEAIQAQSAQVSGVSGATETSGAFQQSLAAALAHAGA